MKRIYNILILIFLSSFSFAQEETRIIDSLESVMAKQEGREKVETMMELSKAFFDFSFIMIYNNCLNNKIFIYK